MVGLLYIDKNMLAQAVTGIAVVKVIQHVYIFFAGSPICKSFCVIKRGEGVRKRD